MTINNKIRDEKLQYDVKKEAAKYLTGEEILPSDQIRMMELAKFTYSPLGKTLEKQKR